MRKLVWLSYCWRNQVLEKLNPKIITVLFEKNKFSLLQCNETKFTVYHLIEHQKLHKLYMFSEKTLMLLIIVKVILKIFKISYYMKNLYFRRNSLSFLAKDSHKFISEDIIRNSVKFWTREAISPLSEIDLKKFATWS